MTRILIAGSPRSGKTTLAIAVQKLFPGMKMFATDDIVNKATWSDASREVATRINQPGPWVIEGTVTTRGIRKWLAQEGLNSKKKPAEFLIYCHKPLEPLTKAQDNMRKGDVTIMMPHVYHEMMKRQVHCIMELISADFIRKMVR